MKKIKLVMTLIFLYALTTSLHAEVPHLVRYQGRAVDSQGQPLISPQAITFKIYDAETAGNLLWSETQPNIQLTDGNFSVLLGQIAPLNLETFNADAWLTITINNEELSPRQRITSVPYAYKADTVAELRGAENVFPGSGNVGIGTLNPSAGLEVTGDPNTNLLLHCNGQDGSDVFIDEAGKSVFAYGNAQIDTDQSKFGGASGLFDGNGDYLSLSDSDDWYFGPGNFTIDFWVRFNNKTNEQVMLGQYVDNDNYWEIGKNSAGDDHKWTMAWASGGVLKGYYIMTNAWAPINGVWYHIAFIRNGASAKLFIDGFDTAIAEVIAFGANDVGDVASNLYIGSRGGTGAYLNGSLDEIRISKGVARWTGNYFDPPVSEYALGGGLRISGRSSFDGNMDVTGNVGIGTENPEYELDVEGTVQAQQYLTGDIIFQKTKDNKLWRMFEEEDGLYLESLKTGKIYKFGLQEINNPK